MEHYAKSTASKMRSWCKNGQSRCNKQTRKHRTRKQIAEPLTKPCRIELERIEDIRNKKVPKSVLAAIKTFEKDGFKKCKQCPVWHLIWELLKIQLLELAAKNPANAALGKDLIGENHAHWLYAERSSERPENIGKMMATIWTLRTGGSAEDAFIEGIKSA